MFVLFFRHHSSFGAVNLPEKVNEDDIPYAFLVRVMLGCICFSKMTLAFCDPKDAISSLGVVSAFSLPFPFALPLLGAPIAGLSSSRFLATNWESSIFCSMSLNHRLQSAIIIFLVAECPLLSVDLQQVFQLLRLLKLHLGLSNMLSAGLSVTVDNTSSRVVSKA